MATLALGVLELRLKHARIVRYEHSTTDGCWAHSLMLSNRFGDPRFELVYRAWGAHVGIAVFRRGQPRWFGLGPYPALDPRDQIPGGQVRGLGAAL